MGGTAQIETAVMDYFVQHSVIMILCSVGLLSASIILFGLIITNKTRLPRWTAVFNIMTMFLIGGLLKPIVTIPGTMNLGGLLMFLGLAIIIPKTKSLSWN